MQIVDTDVSGTHVRLLLHLLTPEESKLANCGEKGDSWMFGFGVGYRPLVAYFFPGPPGWYYLEEKIDLGNRLTEREMVAAFCAIHFVFTGQLPDLYKELPQMMQTYMPWGGIVKTWGEGWLDALRAAVAAEREARAGDTGDAHA